MSRQLILVASYPKSGNTWVRLVFEKLMYGQGRHFSINDLTHGFYGYPLRMLFDHLSPVNAADLLPEEIDEALPGMWRQFCAETSRPHLVKVHDSARIARSGQWLFPPDCVHSVFYLVRHPFDVAVSYARHSNISVADAVDLMADAGKYDPDPLGHLPMTLHPHFGNWSENVTSWIDKAPHTVTIARYEDIHADPRAQFRRLMAAAGFAFPEAALDGAIAEMSFDRLRGEESVRGFKERPATSAAFFRAGRPRAWEGALSEALREKLVRDHGPVMHRLGYLPDGGTVPL